MVCTAAFMAIGLADKYAPPSGAAARAATVAALVAAPIAHHERTAGAAQRCIPRRIAVFRELRDARWSLVRPLISVFSSGRFRNEQSQLLPRQEAQFHPA